MDSRLLKASQKGDVQCFLNLMEEDPLILRSVSLVGCETPLHVTCTAGHLNFLKEIIKLRREFAYEINKDGFTPLHIASANGDLEIVRELLKLDRNLCLIKGKNREIPLHIASVKGRIDVVRELLLADENCIEDITSRGETALHLAMKNIQFEAFEILVKHLKQFNKEQVLNMKDYEGNTVLHLAVSRKQLEVLELVLDENIVKRGILDVNSLNKEGQMPLDVLREDDRAIEDILRQVGALKIVDFHYSGHPTLSQNSVVSNPNRSNNGHSRTCSPSQQLRDYFKYDKNKDSPYKARNTLLVIAILIATATYQAVLSPPGGVWQDDFMKINGTKNSESHEAGKAIMGSKNVVSYCLFLLFNSVGFYMSLQMIFFLTSGFPLQLELQVSLLALVVTYDTCMNAIAPNSVLSTFFTAVSVVMPLTIPFLTIFVRNHHFKWFKKNSNS